MKINPEIEVILKKHNIHIGQGTLALLAIYHDIRQTGIIASVDQQLNVTKIVERDYQNGGLTWHVPLYLGEEPEQDKAWDWIIDWRKLFGDARADAIGSRAACYSKMKKYFAEHPDVRKDEVIEATRMYIRTITNPKYLQKADYFISKQLDGAKGSRLDMYIEILRNSQANPDDIAQRNLGRVAQ